MIRFDIDRQARLDVGAREYGNRSFAKSREILMRELSEEAVDLSAWATIYSRSAEYQGRWRDAAFVMAMHLTGALAYYTIKLYSK